MRFHSGSKEVKREKIDHPVITIAKIGLNSLLHSELRIEEKYLNSLLDLVADLEATVEIEDGFLNLQGRYHGQHFSGNLCQNIYIDERYSKKMLSLQLKNPSSGCNRKNSVLIPLKDIEAIEKLLKLQQRISLIRDITLDKVECLPHEIILTSTEKIKITFHENYLNKILEEVLVGRYGLKGLKLTVYDGYINCKGAISLPEVEAVFDKNIRIADIDLYEQKQLRIEIADTATNHENDRIDVKLNLSRLKEFRKLMGNPFVSLIIDKLVFVPDKKIKCSKTEKSIIFYE